MKAKKSKLNLCGGLRCKGHHSKILCWLHTNVCKHNLNTLGIYFECEGVKLYILELDLRTGLRHWELKKNMTVHSPLFFREIVEI